MIMLSKTDDFDTDTIIKAQRKLIGEPNNKLWKHRIDGDIYNKFIEVYIS